MKIKILLMEDDDDDIENIISNLSSKDFEIVAICKNIEDAIDYYINKEFDIVIIDIFIEAEPQGIYFANQINKLSKNKPFIFLTRSIDKTVFNQAKLTQPYHYLIKPFNKLELQFAIELAIEKFVSKEGSLFKKEPIKIENYFYIKKNQSLKKILISAIQFIQVDKQYCKITTESDQYLLQISLLNFLSKLPQPQFLRVHRNSIINTEKISDVYLNDNLIVLKGGYKIDISRRGKMNFIKNSIFLE